MTLQNNFSLIFKTISTIGFWKLTALKIWYIYPKTQRSFKFANITSFCCQNNRIELEAIQSSCWKQLKDWYKHVVLFRYSVHDLPMRRTHHLYLTNYFHQNDKKLRPSNSSSKYKKSGAKKSETFLVADVVAILQHAFCGW